MEQKEYKFEFSVVMAVYNVEPWLREAVDSLIAQDFGFERIQLIMVDDGSTDGSGAICDEYAARYPENVMVVHKENGGVASARNEGLKHAQGRYLNFMDSDDKLGKNAMKEVHRFFAKNSERTDVVALPLIFFDGRRGEHPLNRKFEKGNRVIDLYREYSLVQLSMASTFVKAESLVGHLFDERLTFAEDAKLMIQVLLKRGTIGAVRTAKYYYRKRTTGESSAIQRSQADARWYLPCMLYFHSDVIRCCEELYGFIPKFVQYTLMYDLQWRVKEKDIPKDILSNEDVLKYRQQIQSVLSYIDDDIILEQRSLWHEHKLFALKEKYGCEPEMNLSWNEAYLRFGNTNCYYISNSQFTIEFIELKENCCIIEGYTVIFPFDGKSIEVLVESNGKLQGCEKKFRKGSETALGERVLDYHGYRCVIPLDRDEGSYSIRFFIKMDGHLIEKRNVVYKQYAPVSGKYHHSYYAKDGWILSARKNKMLIVKGGKRVIVEHEIRLLHELLLSQKVSDRKAACGRLFADILNMTKKKSIWLISDKADRADDNGEAFFIYLSKLKAKGIKPYFLIEKESHDFKKLSQYGKVAPYMSRKHKLLYLLADYTISAYSHDEINNPFYGYSEPYRDMLQKCKYVFLQHGVTKDDISSGVNRYHKNLKMFICAAEVEYKSILGTPAYGYTEDEVVLTGFPRYDRLYHDERNAIVIMPTWRRDLFGDYHPQNSRWDLKPGFRESAYYKFYNGLVNNRRLLEKARELGYEVNFVPHPILFPYIDNFTVPEEVKMWGTDVVYRQMFAENKLLLTDFSSVAFDFAYLRKPVIYTHFDTNHYQEGYFDYERDGFGEVEYDLESTIDRIIEYMENGCQLKDKYRQRIDSFFAFNDKNNCQRVYDKIMELDGRK